MSNSIRKVAKDGVDSVFSYIESAAEATPEGTWWETLSMNDSFYHDISIYNGVAGIFLFLTDYHALMGDASSIELALGANLWCSVNEHTVVELQNLKVR